MTTVFLYIFANLVHIPSLVLRYLPFKNIVSRKQKITLFLIYSISLVLSLITYIVADKLQVAEVAYYKINLFLFCILMTIANIIVIKGHIRQHLFVFGVTALSILMLFTVSLFINERIGYKDVRLGIVQTSVILVICFLVLFAPIKRLITKTVAPFLNMDSRDYWKNIWFIPIAMFFASFLAYPMNTYMNSPMQYLSRIMIGGATLFICRAISNDYRVLLEREILGKQVELQKQYYSELSEKLQNDRRARHDFKHHVAAIRGFAESDDKVGLAKYCNDLEETNYSKYIPLSDNVAIDGILYHYATKSKQSGIKFSSECSFSNVIISDIDLCVLFGNALSNAYEAALRALDNRFIAISAVVDKSFLVISIENGFDGEIKYKNDKIMSRKRVDSEGIGISSMKKICEKYNGSASFKAEGNIFRAGFLLQNSSEPNM